MPLNIYNCGGLTLAGCQVPTKLLYHSLPQQDRGAPSNLTLNVSRDGASNTSLGNLFQCFTTLIVKKFFLISSLNLPSFSLKPLPLVLSQQALAEQPQLSQPVLIGEVFHPSDHLRGPPLDPLKQVHVFLVLRTPELDAVLQDAVGFLGCKHTLTAHVQLFIYQYPQVLLHRAALNPFIPQPVLILGIAPTQGQDPDLALLNLMKFTWTHFSKLSRSIWMASLLSSISTAPLSLVSSANLLRVHSIPLSMSLMKVLNIIGPTVDHYPLDATIQLIPHPLNSPSIKSISLQFREKDVVGDHVKGLTEVQSPRTSPDCHDFSNIMESGLAATSANSLRTLGCISSGPIDLSGKFLPYVQYKSTLFQFKTVVPSPVSTGPVLKGHNKVSLEPSLLQAEQPQISQPSFRGEVFQPSDRLCGPPLGQKKH
ncbi:hypothetical protein QYF61_018390 [Mycteria americana]|uniref:Uncharacterized protein n=1 Tax=Mycteria americana TaxID=33587 RepID=A0AAN7RHL4_MYCAM|nr:hypothetical protein QYF61_018390 [Mycteria americana]